MSIVDITAPPESAAASADRAESAATGRSPAAPDTLLVDLTEPTSRTDPPNPVASDPPGGSRPPTDGPAAATRPTFTITDAATACAVSRKTITRKLADLAEHGAAKDEDGVWRIPVEALLAVGLHPGRSLPSASPRAASVPASTPAPRRPEGTPKAAPSPAPAQLALSTPDVVTIPRERWDDLRLRLARAEAEAAERALALADARLALRALTAAPSTSPGRDAPGAPGASGPFGQRVEDRPDGPSSVVVPPAAGWVMGQVSAPLGQTSPGQPIQVVADPGAAPPATAAAVPAKKRRWWQSAAR